jgi:hypothetical protein
MSFQPSSDRGLGQAARSHNRSGAKLLLIGGAMIVVGVVLILAGSGLLDFFGVVIGALGVPPALAGTALVLSGLVGHHASRQRPFA